MCCSLALTSRREARACNPVAAHALIKKFNDSTANLPVDITDKIPYSNGAARHRQAKLEGSEELNHRGPEDSYSINFSFPRHLQGRRSGAEARDEGEARATPGTQSWGGQSVKRPKRGSTAEHLRLRRAAPRRRTPPGRTRGRSFCGGLAGAEPRIQRFQEVTRRAATSRATAAAQGG